MPDSVSKKRRSEIMSHIKSKDTTIELLVRKRLHALGYRYRVNYSALSGHPDIVFTKRRIVVFIHGCFWHGHDIGCRYAHIPQSKKEYWDSKLRRTKERDKEHLVNLEKKGWNVITIWECEIRDDLDNVISRILTILNPQGVEKTIIRSDGENVFPVG